jgi:hypothetical protein
LMPTIQIQGHPVQVDDSFFKLSPQDQDDTVDEIASHMLDDIKNGRDITPTAPPAPSAPSPVDAYIQAKKQAQPEIDNTPNELGVPVFNKAQSRAQLDQALGPVKKGTILPMSWNHNGEAQFDMSAGIPGMIGSALNKGAGLAEQAMGPGGGASLLNDPSVAGRSLEAASISTGVNPAVRAGDMAIPGVANALRKATPADVAPPTAAMLKKTGGNQFDQLRDLNVDYNSQAVADHAATVQTELQRQGFGPRVAEKTNGVLNDLQAVPSGPSVANIRDLHAQDAAAASAAIGRLEDFLRAPGSKGVVAGPASEVSPLLDQANGNYAAGSRSNTLNALEGSAELRAAANDSGQNLGNKLRQKAAALADPQFPERMSGFNSLERKAIEDVAKGTASANTFRWVGKFLGGGGGLGAGFVGSVGGSVGAALGGVPGAAVGAAVGPAVGRLALGVERGMTRKAFRAADEMVRRRSPLYEQMLREHPDVAPGSPEWKVLMARGLAAQRGRRDDQ